MPSALAKCYVVCIQNGTRKLTDIKNEDLKKEVKLLLKEIKENEEENKN